MSISKDHDLKLKLGNLFLALLFAIVPTSMTIGFLGVHGHFLCRDLDTRLEKIDKLTLRQLDVKMLCDISNIEASYDYIIWIWLFTTIPTWRWFYIGHYRRVKKQLFNE